MDSYSVKRFGLILALQAEMEGMKIENKIKEFNNMPPTFLSDDFNCKAAELRNLSNLHDYQL